MIILPIITILTLLLLNFLNNQSIGRVLANTWIEIVLFVWAVTEVLSVFKVWTGVLVIISWLVFEAVLVIWGCRKNLWKQAGEKLRQKRVAVSIDKGYYIWVKVIGIYIILVLIGGILSSQYNVDSMVYHLPRIMHWIQNKSVSHFAAGFEAQVRYPCLSEYLVAQIYLLGHSDKLANLVQTGAYIGSSIMVFCISRKIGASHKFAFTGSCVYLLMPMAIAQAYSTQTDNIAGFFLLTYIFYILDFIQAEKLIMNRQGFISAILLASNVMLGYLCKPTICFVMVVFFIWMCIVRFLKRDSLMTLLKYAFVGACMAVLLILPTYFKNYQTFTLVDKRIAEEKAAEIIEEGGTAEEVTMPPQIVNPGQALTPDVFNVQVALKDPKVFIVTCVQNIAKNSLSVCLPRYNEKWLELVNSVGARLNIDTSAFRVLSNEAFFYQDMASNPWVMMLIFAAVIVVIIRISRTNKEQTLYGICAVFGFIVQCGFMGYTAYRSRYLVGAMAVMCPAIAVTIEKLRIKNNYKDIILALCIFGAGIGGVNTYSYEIPRIQEGILGGEIHQYFIGAEEDEYVYAELGRIINENGYQKIGLDGLLYLEYPLWQIVNEPRRIENVNMTNVYYGQYEDMEYIPDCIVRTTSESEPLQEGDILNCHGEEYQCMWAIHWYQAYFGLYGKV